MVMKDDLCPKWRAKLIFQGTNKLPGTGRKRVTCAYINIPICFRVVIDGPLGSVPLDIHDVFHKIHMNMSIMEYLMFAILFRFVASDFLVKSVLGCFCVKKVRRLFVVRDHHKG